ncbi:MAG: hypothetical protein AAF430_25200 [Myxococcota bacterium]
MPYAPHHALADLSRQELCHLGREYLLIGHLQDRVALPLATRLVGEAAQTQLSIDEWMGASPIYSQRMQRALGFEGDDVTTVFKGLQLEIGSPHQFMDFQFRVDSPQSGAFWLAHCGALMDVEPFGDKRVKTMCHDIEDPTFDATAAATHPLMKMRPVYRPPRVAHPGPRWPHCHWTVFIDDQDPTPYEQHPNLPRMRETRIAAVPIALPDTEREPGGLPDYSGAFDPGFQLEDLSHRALLIVCQEAAVQAHLLSRSLLLNVEQRHGEEAARDLGRKAWTGAAGMAAHRLKRLLPPKDDIATVATIFQLHPHFQPRTYLDFRVEVVANDRARVSIRDCPALEEADAHSPFGSLSAEPHPALQAIAGMVNPRAQVHAIDAGDARFAWEVVIDPQSDPWQEPPEVQIARISRGFEFQMIQRRPLRT